MKKFLHFIFLRRDTNMLDLAVILALSQVAASGHAGWALLGIYVWAKWLSPRFEPFPPGEAWEKKLQSKEKQIKTKRK